MIRARSAISTALAWLGCIGIGALGACVASCSASTRPIPQELLPLPVGSTEQIASVVPEAGPPDAARAALMAHADAPLTGCVDAQKHQLRVRQLSADRWSIVKEVLPLLRSERKSSITKQLDQTTGQQIGYTIVDVGDGSCLQALGFRNGDLVRSLNGHNLTDWGAAMQSFAAITKDGAAIVRLERGGKAMTVVYEIQN